MSDDPAEENSAEPGAAQTPKRGDKVLGWVGSVNRQPQLIEGLRRVRRALPGDPAFGDPLSTAGPGSARAIARVADRFLDHQPGASREMSLGALQVWQALLERTGRGRGTQEVTIVFTDLVGFSSWSLPAGDSATLALLRDVARAVETPIVDRGGHVVKRLGDGVMAVFSSPDRAIDAVFAAQEALAEVEVDGYRPRMRVGIHTGSPRQIGSDWLGVDVTVAARMMELGGDGNVMASSATLSSLQPGTLDELGVGVKPWRRAFFAPAPSGVPSDLGIWRLRLRRP